MSFCFTEYDKVMGHAKPVGFFVNKMAELETLMRLETELAWPNLRYGGATPGSNQYGRVPIPPTLFADENADVLDHAHEPTTWGVDSYQQLFTSTSPTAQAVPGWKLILQGALGPVAGLAGGGLLPEDWRMAIAGYAFSAQSSAITKIYHEIGDVKYFIMDIEERHSYNKPAIILEEGFVVPEETRFLLQGFLETDAYERVVPLGFACYRRKDTRVIR